MRARTGPMSPAMAAVSIAIGLVVTAGVTTVWAQGSGTVDPPPSVAFVATAFNYPDALAVGPVAGRLGAPLLLTAPDALDDEAADGLAAADPDLVIIAGGTAAISQAVEDQIAGLLPDATIERAAGATRTETAQLLAELIDSFNPAWLPAGATAADADRLAGAAAWNYVDGRFVDLHDTVEMPWGEPTRMLAMEAPAGHYQVAWEASFGSQSAPEDFDDGYLECYVSTAGDLHISGSGIQAGAADRVFADSVRLLDGFPVMRASSGLLHPVRHDRGWFAVECVNTFEDDAGSPMDVALATGGFSTNKLERQPWVHPRPVE